MGATEILCIVGIVLSLSCIIGGTIFFIKKRTHNKRSEQGSFKATYRKGTEKTFTQVLRGFPNWFMSLVIFAGGVILLACIAILI
ncbi:hypothetical protein [Mesoplasma photuris]|uniref:hypothetical protein n=1 Tax=Mesoplasma photuris TaxID=217731 RepID=UPI0004E261BC|nr:hypothetical protein [Mesoplasma photuris]